MKTEILTFDQFLDDFQESDTFSDLLENESDKSYHNEGCFGLSHRQIIEGWKNYLGNEIGYELDDQIVIEFSEEIDSCLTWHENNGSVDEII